VEHLRFGGRSYRWTFLRAEVSFPILGMDFLRQQGLLLDAAAGRLLVGPSRRPLSLSRQPSGPSAAIVLPEPAPQPSSFPALLQEFQDVINPSKKLPPTFHGVEHHLRTQGPPVSSPFRRLDPEKLAAAKAEFAALERDGIVRRSNSPWASPLHMVKKADGSWRPCGDYRRLNGVTVPDSYPLPNMMDFTAKMAGCRFFTKIDLRKGYHQIPMHSADVPKTAIITPFGLFEYTRMTFGMRNAGNTFQRLMDRVMAGCNPGFAYLENIIVGSSSLQQHLRDVREVFQRLHTAGLVVNGEKCLFAVQRLEFLGHQIAAGGITPLPQRVAALRRHPRPGTVKELQGFLGMVNFYRRFIKGAAHILRPLTDALRGSPPPSSAVTWSDVMQSAFEEARDTLAQAVELVHPCPKSKLSLSVDASSDHVGAVLQQRVSPSAAWQPLGFFSQKLTPAQVKYSAFDRELLACVESIRHFRYMLEGRRFTLYTDHKPLTFALHKVSDSWTARQSRHLAYVAEFTTDVQHVPGADNVVADTLSRPPPALAPTCAVPASAQQLDFPAIAAAQRTCPSVEAAIGTSLQLRLVRYGDVRVLCDVRLAQPRPFIPLDHRRAVFDIFHCLAHPGIRATRRLMAARVIWEGMHRDVQSWCRDCQDCQRAKITKQPTAPVQPIPVPLQRFLHVHVDLVGPLPAARDGSRYLFTMIDRTSRWLEAVPIKNMEAATCAEVFISAWVARFGVPAQLTSDQGRQFSSAIWAHVCQQLGVQHQMTTAYHPQANGMVERAHRQLKDALRARLAGKSWLDHLPWVLLGLRAAPKEDSGLSSAEVLYGEPLTLPGQFVAAREPDVRELIKRLQHVPHLLTRPLPVLAAEDPPQVFQAAQMVYVRNMGTLPPLSPQYRGPFRVLARSAKHFKLQIGARTEQVTVDRLKPHLGAVTAGPALPPVRGRPARDHRTYADVVTGGGPCGSPST